MSGNPLVELAKLGQSVWFDNIERGLIVSGGLQEMIDRDDLRGVTSNPAIFEKAIGGSELYAEQLRGLAGQGKSALEIYEALAVQDVRMALDILRPVYDRTEGLDGYVSLECSPLLANDTAGTIDEARRLWRWLDRPNAMIKIPATGAGFEAIETCLYEGINVNITLIFSLDSYRRTIEAYLRALERRAAEGRPVERIASVASFFVSRIDTAVDRLLNARIEAAPDEAEKERLRALLGRAAIANAKMAYQVFKEEFGGERFAALRARGARVQRPLWASTSTKNPAYPDVYYVEALIGPDTVDTMPPATLDAFRDHGRPRITIEDDLDGERAALDQLEAAGISLDQVTAHVLEEGVRLFVEPFEKLLATMEKRRKEELKVLSTES